MNNRTHAFLSRAAVAAAVTLGLSHSAFSAEGSGTMEVNAALTQALSVTCDTALNFGMTSLVAGTRDGGDTTVTVATDGEVSAEDSDEFAVNTDSNAAAGICNVTGSQEADGTTLTVDLPTSTTLSAADTGGPGTGVSGMSVGSITGGTGNSVTDGEATITLGGTLTIPASLETANMGNYTGTLKLTVND